MNSFMGQFSRNCIDLSSDKIINNLQM